MAKTVTLTLTEEHALIVLALLRMDGADDYIGKETDLPWDEVLDVGDSVVEQLVAQGVDL